MMGWECPKCHACYSPSVQKCTSCAGQGFTVRPPYPTPYWPLRPYHPTPSDTAAPPLSRPVNTCVGSVEIRVPLQPIDTRVFSSKLSGYGDVRY